MSTTTPSTEPAPSAAPPRPAREHEGSVFFRSLPPVLAIVCLLVLLIADLCGPDSAEQFPLPADAKVAAAVADLSGGDASTVPFDDLSDYPCEWPRGGAPTGWTDVVPEKVKALAGRQVGVVGWSIPLVLDGTRVKSFLLSRVHPSCCFGGLPQPNELITVELPDGEEIEYDAHTPVVAVGTLVIGDESATGMSGVYSFENARAARVPLD